MSELDNNKVVTLPVESVEEVIEEQVTDGKIGFNGEDVKLKFPLFALMKLEDEYNVKLSDLEENSDSISLITKLVWAGLLYKQPNLTLEEVAMQFEISDLKDIAGAISVGVSGTGGK